MVQAEAVVDALLQDPAQLAVPFEDQDFPRPVFIGGVGRGQPAGAAADNYHIILFHYCSSSGTRAANFS